jgi:signal transduction histidine kinase
MEVSQLSLLPRSDIKILVVDDREDNLYSIEAILSKDNYTIVKANSGRAALKILLKQHDFSLILMDVQMPDLNGFETANIIYERDKLKNIPIVFITAYSNDEDHMFRGYKMGGVDYIYKPINPELLLVKVSVFVDLYRKNQQLQTQEKKLLAINRSLQKEVEERKLSEAKVLDLNQQLTANNQQLVRMYEELDQFAYMASHDLQEPLRKIQIFSDKIIGRGLNDAEAENYFQRIMTASRRMQSLINNLLDFSRHSVDNSKLERTDLNLVLRDILSQKEIEIEKTNARIYCDKLPVVSAVPALMQQLFSNLIGNAIKFRKKDVDPVVEIRSSPMSPAEVEQYLGHVNGSTYMKLQVVDNGIGFEEKHTQDIFKVFKRLHSYQQFEGTGVGLAICKKIIEKHGGFITAESIPDKGSNFIIGIPFSKVLEPIPIIGPSTKKVGEEHG